MGFNEAAGYGAVALTALATGYIAEAARPAPGPFLLGIAFAALGLGLSALFVRETRDHARLEAAGHVARADGRHDHLHDQLTDREVFAQTSFREPALSSAQPGRPGQQPQRRPGLGPVPDPLRRRRPVRRADRPARRPLPRGLGARAARHRRALGPRRAASGSSSAACGVQAARARPRSPRRRVVRGLGARRRRCSGPAPPWSTRPCSPPSATSPTPPGGPAPSAIYRLWRDGGFAVGALLAGVVADALGIRAAIWAVAALTAVSGVVVAVRMYETHQRASAGDAAGPEA